MTLPNGSYNLSQGMDRGRRKRVADVSEKLGVGLYIAVFAQGVFGQQLSAFTLVAAIAAFALATTLIVVSVFLSKSED